MSCSEEYLYMLEEGYILEEVAADGSLSLLCSVVDCL